MVQFLKDVELLDGGLAFKAKKKYLSKTHPTDPDMISVHRPDSSKQGTWWASFPKTAEGTLFRTLERTEMTMQEIIAENKVLGCQ